MPRPHGHDHATCVDPTSGNDEPQASPMQTVLHPPTTSAMEFFQRMVLLMESTNALKCHVNVEKQAHRDNPAHLELVSSDEEELPLPVSSVPLMPIPTMGPVPLLVNNEPDALPTSCSVGSGHQSSRAAPS